MKLNQLKMNRDVTWNDVELYERYMELLRTKSKEYAKAWKNMLPTAQSYAIDRIIVDINQQVKNKEN